MKRRSHPHGFIAVVTLAIAASWSHHGRADAPMGRYIIGNGTVLDTKTNLMWQQGFAPNSLKWNEAQAYCEGLVLNGKSDWRLPSMKELQTLVDEKRTTPAIDPTAFGMTTPSEYFWTSSPWAGSGSAAWVVGFDSGYTNNDVVTNTNRVRCVR